MTTEGKKFKLFIGDEEIAEGFTADCNLDLIEHEKETPNFKASHSWSGTCNINPDSINYFYRQMRLNEIKDLTDNYNRILKAKKI